MKIVFDLHTHTIASGHAYSTLKENIEEAVVKGLLAMGTSDHARLMPGTVSPIFFDNYRVIPREILGVRIYKGIEANIIDYKGNIDVEEPILTKMEYIIASLHSPCIQGGTVEENTAALIGAMQNPYVKIIGHPDDDRYPLDYEVLVKAAKENGVALELNNSSLIPGSTRQNARVNAKVLLEKCRFYQVPIVVGSDSHIFSDIGRFNEAVELLKEMNFPEELVVNTKLENIELVLNNIME